MVSRVVRIRMAVVGLSVVALAGAFYLGRSANSGAAVSQAGVPTTLSSVQSKTQPPIVTGNGSNGSLLALGDSVAFGVIPSKVAIARTGNLSIFISYANYVASWYHLNLINLACPGETTASMINPSAQSNGCENHPHRDRATGTFTNLPGGFRTAAPLHVKYSGSQLSAAVSFIRSSNIKLITLDIGANDLFLCAGEQHGCTSQSAQSSLISTVTTNLRTIISTILATGYKGKFVVLDYYSPNYNSPINARIVRFDNVIDGVVNGFPNVTLVSGYNAFKTASASSGGNSCAAKLLLPSANSLGGTSSCNIHPSYLGHQILAKAIESALGSKLS